MAQILAGVESKDFQFQQLKPAQLIELIQGMYDLNPEDILATKLRGIDSKAKPVKNLGNDIGTMLLNAYSHVVHWNGKKFDLHEINTSKTKLIERVQDTTIEMKLVLNQIGPGYISSQVSGTITTETFWNNFFQILGETMPLSMEAMQEALAAAVEQKKLAYCVNVKDEKIDPKTRKPDDFPTWAFGKHVDAKEMRISATSWLLPPKDAETIIANGETPPDTPAPHDIPALKPFERVANVSWDPVPKAKYYKVFRGNSLPIDTDAAKPLHEGLQTRITDELLAPGVYHYIVIAGNEHGESSPSGVKSVEYRTDFPPFAPKLKVFMPATVFSPRITVRWEVATGADSYVLLQSDKVIEAREDGTTIHEGTGLEHELDLPAFGNYYFAVHAVNAHGTSGVSNYEGISYGQKTPPVAPKLAAEVSGDGRKVDISWTEVPEAKGYRLYKDSNPITKITPRLTLLVDKNAISHKDSISQAGTYYYVVIARNDHGDSVLSNCAEVSIQGAENEVVISLQVDPEYLTDFSDAILDALGGFIKIGAAPQVHVTIKGKIPGTITKMAQGSLKSKVDEALKKVASMVSDVEIDWDL